ncbi:MAG: MltA-interacting MipA family protein [Thermodesulfobacteriota bacterium]
MKSSIFAVLMAALMIPVLGGGVTPGWAAEATTAADLVSAYVWRGMTFNDGLVAQPSVDVSANGFGVNVWGNIDIDDYDGTLEDGEFSEVDLTLSYAFALETVDVTAGYIEYLFPEGDPGSREIFLSLSTPLGGGTSIGFDGYYDFDECDDYYADVYVAYSRELERGLSIGVSALAGMAGEDMSDGADGGLHEYTLSADAGYSVTDAVDLSAFIAYTDSFDDDVLPEQDVDVYGGFGVACTF